MLDFLGGLLGAGLNFFGSQQNRQSQERMAAQNIALQREFAQNGIQWRVADANAAGIHPLAALGASTTSFSPVSVGSTDLPDLSSMGQNIGRALKAAMSGEDREEMDNREMRKLNIEGKRLENDALRAATISKIRREAVGVGPQMPINGNTPSDRMMIPRNRMTEEVLRSPSLGGEQVKVDDIKQKQDDVPELKYSRPYGFRMWHNPYFGDAQSYTNRYGESEAAEMLKWGINHVADVGYSISRGRYEWPKISRVPKSERSWWPRIHWRSN